MTTYIFAATNSSAADRAAATHLWNDSDVPQTYLDLFAAGNATFEFRPGTYYYEHSANILRFGSNSIVKGSKPIPIPASRRDLIRADPATMAVFASKRSAASCTMCDTTYHAIIETAYGATNVTLQDFYMLGYCVIRFCATKNSWVRRVVIQNYLGTYPSGTWCNMGYNNATGDFFMTGTCDTITFESCVSQFSFHAAFLIHSGGAHTWIRNITFTDCRALYSGCGQLRGDTAEAVADSRAKVTETDGCGGRDWSTGFDIDELASSEHIHLIDCYSYSAWKAGFYQEPRKNVPEDTEYYDHTLTRCVSEDAGQRAVRGNGTMFPKESEACNFFISAATLTDCVSRNGFKAGYLFTPEGMPQEAAKGVTHRIVATGCIDCGSRYGFVMEYNMSGKLRMDNCIAINNTNRALRLYGGTSPIICRNMRIRTQLPTKPPIKLGKMCRLPRHNSWDSHNQSLVNEAVGFTVSMEGVELSGTVEGLQAGTPAVEIKSGSHVNGASSYPCQGVSVQTATAPLDIGICTKTPGSDPTPGSAVDANFTVTPSSGSAPLAVAFHDTSTGGPTEWSWSFGDGGASSAQHPTHTYSTPGEYPVTLTVRNATTTDTEPRMACVTVHDGTAPPPPVGTTHFALSDLSVTPSVVRPGETVTISFRVSEAAA